jgi:arsenate reductase
MAEGFARSIKGDQFNFYSAGTKKHGMNLYAVKVMQEVGVDISQHQSKTTDELPDIKFSVVFTVCSDAHENCPIFPSDKTIHVGFDDPPRLAKNLSDEEEVLKIYRKVRDEIKDFIINIENYLEK